MTPEEALKDMKQWLETAYKASMAEGKNRTEPDKTYYWGEARAFRDAKHHLMQIMKDVVVPSIDDNHNDYEGAELDRRGRDLCG